VSGGEDRVSPLPVAPLIQPRWSADRRERSLVAVHGRVQRRARNVRVLVAVSLVTVLALLVGFGLRPRLGAGYAMAERDGRQVRFADGSSVQLLDAHSELDVGAASPSAVEVALRAGSAEFEITPNPQRRFIVHAGVAEISVLGTHFRVFREAQRVKVEVTRGRVEVRFIGGARQLTAGESNWFPPPEPVAQAHEAADSPAPAPSANGAPGNVPLPSVVGANAEGTSTRRRFLEHAAHKQYAAAYSLLERTPEVVGSSAEDLMLAADAARFSGHPQQATHFLERMTREHPQDSVAPLAAFTLGRIYLSQLGQPARAADAFALSRRLAPGGSLAEDALAREAEAAELAGQHGRARALVGEYARRFPSGRRLDGVRKSLGLGSAP
jgi:transmembrane sensor